MNKRLNALREAMAAQGLQALFMTKKSNVRYLSGFSGEDSCLLLTGNGADGKNYLLTDSRYTCQATAECKDFEVIDYRETALSLEKTVSLLCREHNCSRLGFEKEHISYHMYENLVEQCQGFQLLPCSSLVEKLRSCKDPEEILLMRQACEYTDRVFAKICEFIQPGQTEKEVEWRLFCLFHEYGCESSFPPVIASGERGALPHAAATEKKLKKGEFITIDFGCAYQAYHADMTRSLHLGPASPKEEDIYRIVLEANLLAEEAIRAGISGKQLDAVARDFIADKGYGDKFAHALGHGVGLEIHELPTVSPRGQGNIPENSFITIEPGIYIPGWGGIRIEDTLLVRDSEGENLFLSTKELICL
ncbi:MAG: Xaa-Pro peptidase family protein [Bacillota bacterium]|nr:Xaa-Pro peptidase family protein [Bacillota bacterium]